MKKRDTVSDGSDAETDAFARAMAEQDVVPLPRDSGGRVRAAAPVDLPPAVPSPGASRSTDDDDASADFAAHGVDRREIRKLKRGDYAAAARCDLHGMTASAASSSVRHFLDRSRRSGHRCVCIVHGRGLRSAGGVAVLKARVRGDLRSHPAVLAYADAPRTDGGSGAVYVLLRRPS